MTGETDDIKNERAVHLDFALLRQVKNQLKHRLNRCYEKKRVGAFDRASEGQMKKSQCNQLNRRWESETLVQRYNHCPESMFDKNDL